MAGEGRTVVMYCRISRDRPTKEGEREAAGVRRQETDCRQLIESKGYTLSSEPFVDNDVSAYAGKPRPAYREMIKLIESDGVNAIVVWHMDRLYRSNAELEELITLAEKKDLSILSVTGDSMDLATTDGQLVARILTAVARKSSDDARRRIKRFMAEKKARGEWTGGGCRRYGYRSHVNANDKTEWTIDQDEAKVLREIARRVIAGESVNAVTLNLNE